MRVFVAACRLLNMMFEWVVKHNSINCGDIVGSRISDIDGLSMGAIEIVPSASYVRRERHFDRIIVQPLMKKCS